MSVRKERLSPDHHEEKEVRKREKQRMEREKKEQKEKEKKEIEMKKKFKVSDSVTEIQGFVLCEIYNNVLKLV